MVTTYAQALQSVSNHSIDTRKKLNNATTQRRNSIYNSFGQERKVNVTPTRPGTLYLPITSDLSTFIRWNFKLVINPLASVTTEPKITDLKLILDGMDVSFLFYSQFPMPTTSGIYPNNSMGDFYDIINICEMLSDLDRDVILSSGMHSLRIECDASIEVTLLEFVSYSFIARHGQPVNEYSKMEQAGPVIPGDVGPFYDEVSAPRLASFTSKEDLLMEQDQLEQEYQAVLNSPDINGSRAQQVIQSAQIVTRLNEIELELAKVSKMEELENG